MTTMPGMLTIDYVDSAIGQIHGVAAIGEFHALIDDTMWGLPVFAADPITSGDRPSRLLSTGR